MELQHREALSALRLTWAPTADDLWHSQGALHVRGMHDRPMADVMAAFGDAEREADSSPLGVVVRGPAGSGKTHLLGQVREQVQTGGGFFFLVELLDAAGFWQSARAGILESLGRPGSERETQLKDLLWELSSVAHISRANRRAVIGDDDLTPDILNDFVNALHKVHRHTVKRTHHTLRALVLLGAGDLELQDIGEAFLTGNGEREAWGLPAPTLTAQESVRDISRLIALAGPSVLALDQIDTLLAQSVDRTDTAGAASNRDLEQVAHGLMSIRQTMRRTVGVVACLPAAWEAIQDRATATVQDRFRTTALLQGLPTPDVGRAILERRFTASYSSIGFTAPYPSWPILPAAFDEATQYTPRQLLKRVDTHVRRCLDHDVVEELASLTAEAPETTKTPWEEQHPETPANWTGASPTTGVARSPSQRSTPTARTPPCPACCRPRWMPGSPSWARPVRRSAPIRCRASGWFCTGDCVRHSMPRRTTSGIGRFAQSRPAMPSQSRTGSGKPGRQRVSTLTGAGCSCCAIPHGPRAPRPR